MTKTIKKLSTYTYINIILRENKINPPGGGIAGNPFGIGAKGGRRAGFGGIC